MSAQRVTNQHEETCPKCHLERWQFVEHNGKTWNRCHACGWGELWAGGQYIAGQPLPVSLIPEEGK